MAEQLDMVVIGTSRLIENDPLLDFNIRFNP